MMNEMNDDRKIEFFVSLFSYAQKSHLTPHNPTTWVGHPHIGDENEKG